TGVDTGMGLERIASVVQGVPTNFETDLLRPIVDKVVEVSGQPYYSDERGFPHRVIGDHARACAFIIADGLLPSNEGRGYVLRRILRRAALYGRKLGLERPLLADVAEAVIARMGQAYPELVKNGEFISRVIGLEEERFDQTLDVGLNLLDGLMVEVKGATVIPGDVVFRLYDTYGFPPEITEEVAAEKGLGIDRAGFDAAMAEQRERSRTAQISASGTLGMSGEVTIEVKRAGAVYEELGLPPNPFVGYETLSHSSVVVGLVVGGERVEAISQGQEAEVILLETPFYGEMGGQVGDAGEIRGPSGRFRVRDTVYALPGLAVHRGMMEEGELETGEIVQAEVDKERRLDIARNHTATHLLHAALRQILGSHVRQAGSLVAPDRLRFDFSHMAAVTPDELQQIQRWVNDKIRRNLPVRSEVKSYSQALAEGALAFFGEKYGDEVRMMAIGKDTQVSAELCGGTHLSATGEIGFLQIVSEGSIGANMRRIEAVTGRGAEAWLEERLSLLEKVSQQLKTTPAEVEGKVVNLASELEKETKKSAAMERELLRHRAEPLLSQVESIDGVTFLAGALPAATMEALRETGDWLRDQLRGGFVLLGSVYNDRPNFVAMAAANVVAKGIHAGEIVKQVAAVVGGGGTHQLCQGSGRDKAKLKEALERGRELVRHQLRASSGG
ncbi:MAG: alanine--tRNA ligase, partial [Chloroflexi bacterium]|nr:alanine--tRNA ligase [Chloroflexota bacterium]